VTVADGLADDAAMGDPYDTWLALRAVGLLRDFNRAGVVSAADVHVAQTLGRLGAESDERVLLALALAVRGVRLGSVCVVLDDVRSAVAPDDAETGADTLAWPDRTDWRAACAASPLVADDGDGDGDTADHRGRPLRLVEDLLYLDRYWRQEEVVRTELELRARRGGPPVDVGALRDGLARLFPAPAPDRQRLAAAMTVLRYDSIIAGGPGTGKTTTVARLIALLRSLPGDPPRVALAAPTGKAAARLQEAVTAESSASGLGLGDVTASTLHRLLGWRPGSRSHFRHDRANRLPYDVIVVDESSMVSLTLMSRLVEAVRPDARLVLVGDPDQLASVEAGAVLGDLVGRGAAPGQQAPALLGELVGADLAPGEQSSDEVRNGVVRLTETHRFGQAIGALAAAIQVDDADQVLALLRSGDGAMSFVESADDAVLGRDQVAGLRTDVVATAEALGDAAAAGDAVAALAGLEHHRLLCAHRHGPYGVSRWTWEIDAWLAAELGDYTAGGEWYLGRPLLITGNDYDLDLFNGDTGVVVRGADGPVAAFGRGAEPILVNPSRLSAVQTVHAMTVHRAQGSQFDRVSLLLPASTSPLLTRELFYTAVTRAKEHVRVIGSEAAVRRAVGRPIVRASGLRRRAPSTPPIAT
jgi:exodeoxyribonuclease V alpha subunit